MVKQSWTSAKSTSLPVQSATSYACCAAARVAGVLVTGGTLEQADPTAGLPGARDAYRVVGQVARGLLASENDCARAV